MAWQGGSTQHRRQLAALAGALALAGLPSAAQARTPDPLPGYPSVDYDRWRVVRVLEGADRGTWSPGGSRLVLRDRIIDVRTGRVVDRIPFPGTLYRPSWSPDGRTIVFDAPRGNATDIVETRNVESLQAEGEGNDLWAYDLPTRRFTRLTRSINGSNNFARFAHHKSRLTWIRSGVEGGTRFTPLLADLVRSSNGAARLRNEKSLVTDRGHPAYGAFNRIGEFTADDAGVLLISTRSNAGNGDVWKIDLRTRRWTNLTAAPSWEEHPRSSPNGQKVSFMSTRDYPVQSANVGLQVSQITRAPGAFDNLLIVPFAVAGTRYAFAGEEYLANPDGTEPRSLTFNSRHGIEAGWFSRGGEFSPDGARMALAQRPINRRDVPGLPPGTVVEYPGRVGGRTPRTLIVEFGRSAVSGDRGGRPRLKLRLSFRATRPQGRRRCSRGRVRATIVGRDRRLVRRADFYLGRRRVARDRSSPFRTKLKRSWIQRRRVYRVRARVTLTDGRRLTLRRTLGTCPSR